MTRGVVAWFLIGVVIAADADAPLTFEAGPGVAQWEFSGSPWACELGHVVPNFGHARFIREAGQDVTFELASHHVPFVPGFVEVSVRAPVWHPDYPEAQPVARLTHDGGTLRLGPEVANRLLVGLYAGRTPHLVQPGVAAVSVSAVSAGAGSVVAGSAGAAAAGAGAAGAVSAGAVAAGGVAAGAVAAGAVAAGAVAAGAVAAGAVAAGAAAGAAAVSVACANAVCEPDATRAASSSSVVVHVPVFISSSVVIPVSGDIYVFSQLHPMNPWKI